MKIKITILILSILMLSSCEVDQATQQRSVGGVGFMKICLEGTEYYKYYDFGGYQGYFGITPVIIDGQYKECSNSIQNIIEYN